MFSNVLAEMKRQDISGKQLIRKTNLKYPSVWPKIKGREKYHVPDITLKEAFEIRKALGVRTSLDVLFKEDLEEVMRKKDD